MAIEKTVAEVAKELGVSVQTVRNWVVEGAPDIRAGRRGGPGTILDGTRLPAWMYKRRYHGDTTGDRMQNAGLPCGGNFLRWLVEYHSRKVIEALGIGWRTFYDTKYWRELGIKLTDKQARELTWRAFGLSALHAAVYTFDQFDTDLERDTDGRLDDWASILFGSDFETSWTNQDTFPVPEEISELVPADKLAKLADTTVVSMRKGRRRKGQ